MSTNYLKPVTLSDLGQQLNLSKRAVSQALSDRKSTVKVSSETRDRVRKLAKELGYRHNTAARALTTGRTGLFGILCQQSRSHVSHEQLFEVTKAFERRGLTPIILQPSRTSHAYLQNALDTLADAHVDGALVLRHSHIYDDQHVRSWLQRGKQMTAIGPDPLENVVSFVFDRKQSYELILEHLADRNCRDIVDLFEGMTHFPFAPGKSAEQMMGNLPDHLRHLQLSTLSTEEKKFVPSGSTDEKYAFCYQAMLKIIESGKLPDAILCHADSSALAAMKACSERGVRVPQDLLITGHGNEPAASVGAVTITTVAAPIQRAADDAVDYLLRASRDPGMTRPENRLYPFELIPRMSTAIG